MSPEVFGLIIGGIIPAVLFGFSGVLTRAVPKSSIGIGLYLMVFGISIFIVGLGFYFAIPDKSITSRAAVISFFSGFVWAIGGGMVFIGLNQLGMPLGKLVPLYNMNTLVAVLLGLWIFAEWKQVKVPQLLLGSILVVVGGTLVAKA